MGTLFSQGKNVHAYMCMYIHMCMYMLLIIIVMHAISKCVSKYFGHIYSHMHADGCMSIVIRTHASRHYE